MLSRIGRAAYRSSRASLTRGAVSGSYGVRSANLSEFCGSCENIGLGFVRSYLSSIGAGKHVLKNNKVLKELDLGFGNPRLRRLFCSEAPKKRKYEKYYPKNKTEIPKGNGKKSGAKEDSSSGSQSNNPEMSKQLQDFVAPLLLIGFVLTSMFLSPHQQTQAIPSRSFLV